MRAEGPDPPEKLNREAHTDEPGREDEWDSKEAGGQKPRAEIQDDHFDADHDEKDGVQELI